MVNNSKPLISITTPCWNSAKTIERTLKSVLDQSFKDYEYIIVDGGSTDGTLDIIKKYEPLFEGRMRWISEKDKGIYDAINKAIQLTSGVYCWNVNSDDYAEEGALETIEKTIKKHKLPDSVLVFSMVTSKADGTTEKTRCTQESIARAYNKDWMIPHPATVVPKCVYGEYGLYDTGFKICGDMDWFHRIYKAGVTFITSKETITHFSLGGISTSRNYRKEAKDRLRFLNKKYNSKLRIIWNFIKWHKYVIFPAFG